MFDILFSKTLYIDIKKSVNTCFILSHFILLFSSIVCHVFGTSLATLAILARYMVWNLKKKDKSTIKKKNEINYVIRGFIFWMKLKDKIKPDQCCKYQCLLFSMSYRTTHSKHVLSANTRVTIRASSLTARHCVIIHFVGNPYTAWIAICI